MCAGNRSDTVACSPRSRAVWDFHIGGYQVCEKWLKDRRGRTLSCEDIKHYQKIVVALEKLGAVAQIALRAGALLAHQVVQSGFATHQFAGCGFGEAFDDRFAGFDLIFFHNGLLCS